MKRSSMLGRATIRLADAAVNLFVLVVILLLLGYGSYAMWDAGQLYKQADAQKYATYEPVNNDTASFAELQAINPDVFAWLTVYGTGINYPMVQGADDVKYLNTDAEGGYSLSGAIFLAHDSKPDFSDFSSIVYGHHMEQNKMFGDIGSFADKSFFDAHRYGKLFYGGQDHGLEFFAFLQPNAYDTSIYRTGITGAAESQDYLKLLLSSSLYTRSDVSVQASDHIVLLSTCSETSTNGRDILVGKITGQVFDDPFPVATRTNTIPVIGQLPGIWRQLPSWVRDGIEIVPMWLILLLALVVHRWRKKKSVDEMSGANQ